MCTVEFIFVAIRGSDVCKTLSLENDKVREKWGRGDRLRHHPVGIVDNVLGDLGACPPSPIHSSETFPRQL